jgi:uncharacterized protein YdeI (YjbR/CyaY-like superfamily)
MAQASAPRAFRTPAQFRAWLTRHHDKATELLVRIYKNHAAAKGMTNSQAVDEALCFGWIDGIRRSIDADSFSVRFTPRKPRSIWSRVNLAKVEALKAGGRMAAPGLAVFEARDSARTGLYSFERGEMKFNTEYRARFKKNAKAWTWFQGQAPWYQRIVAYFVMTAKRKETQLRRLDNAIACSAQEKRISSVSGLKEKTE